MSFKVLCDVHIAIKVAKFFAEKGYEAVHVNNILDSYHTKDSVISDYANTHGFTVITKDIDFKDSHFLQGKPQKLLYITLGNIPTISLLTMLEKNLVEIINHFENSNTCFLEFGDGYIKVIK